MIAAETGEAVVPVGVDEGGVEGGDERRGEGGGDAIAVGPCAEIEGSGEAVGGGAGGVFVEDDGETGDAAEAFATGGRGDPDGGEVEGDDADGADGVDGEADAAFRAESGEGWEVGEVAGTGFAVGGPEPADFGVAVEEGGEFGDFEGFAPWEAEVFVGEPETAGVIAEAFAEFAVAEDHAGFVEEEELGADEVVGEGGRA